MQYGYFFLNYIRINLQQMRYNNLLIIGVLFIFLGLIFFSGNSESSFYSLEGEEVILEQKYKGKISVLAFTFMSCPSICPMTNVLLKKLDSKFGDKINIVNINVDPINDTPEKIKQFMINNEFKWDVLVSNTNQLKSFLESLDYDDASLLVSSPGAHPPGLHLMDEKFNYTKLNYFPITKDYEDLVQKINEKLKL
tara:strand:- start:104 stop:688 length:585 start_codon:yes stop_codon:yes gene_type:complete